MINNSPLFYAVTQTAATCANPSNLQNKFPTQEAIGAPLETEVTSLCFWEKSSTISSKTLKYGCSKEGRI